MTADVIWPTWHLRPKGIDLARAVRTVGGGRSFILQEQVVIGDAGFHLISLLDIQVYTDAHQRALRALQAQIDGRATTVLVPFYDNRLAPWPVVNGRQIRSARNIAFDDGTLFDDGTGFTQDAIDIRAAAPAPDGTVALQLAALRAGPIGAGMRFSYGERAYLIEKMTTLPVAGTFAGSSARMVNCKVWPPFREDIPSGARLEFDFPVCICRLQKDDALTAALDLRRYGSFSVTFEEA